MADSVYACLTTVPDRTEALRETVESLINQVDRLHIFLHGYNPVELPDFLENEKIELAYDIEWGDNGDLDKFHFTEDLKGYILICDDDLIYPADYAEKMVAAIDKYERKALISCHGSILKPLPIAHYYLDRFVYPCLGNVYHDTEVQIPGTGVMAFHTDINFDFKTTNKLANMADLHVAVWALEKNISMIVIPHLEGWIRHSPYVTQDKTIFGRQMAIGNTFEQVSLINSRADIFQTRRLFSSKKKLPMVSIVIANSRLKSHPEFLRQCYDSVRQQTYQNIQIVVIENYDKLMSIGKCFNEGVKRSKGKYVLFLGDDDFITADYVTSLVSIAEDSGVDNVVGANSYLTMFHYNDQGVMKREPRELLPTGMWLRSYLKKNPFKEYLNRYVDTELMDRTKELNKAMVIAAHCYGYFYRAHPQQTSGYKALVGEHKQAAQNHNYSVRQRIKEIEQ